MDREKPKAKIDTKEHWCETHKTKWFMAGKMKSFAHAVKDDKGVTIEWCYEPASHPVPPGTSRSESIPSQAEAELNKDTPEIVEYLIKAAQEKPPEDTATLGTEKAPTVAKFREQIRGMGTDRFGGNRVKELAFLEQFGVKKLDDVPDNELPTVYKCLTELDKPAETQEKLV